MPRQVNAVTISLAGRRASESLRARSMSDCKTSWVMSPQSLSAKCTGGAKSASKNGLQMLSAVDKQLNGVGQMFCDFSDDIAAQQCGEGAALWRAKDEHVNAERGG